MQSLLPDRLASLKLDIQSTDASSPRAVAKLHLPFLDGIVSKTIKKTKSEHQELSIHKFLTLQEDYNVRNSWQIKYSNMSTA